MAHSRPHVFCTHVAHEVLKQYTRNGLRLVVPSPGYAHWNDNLSKKFVFGCGVIIAGR